MKNILVLCLLLSIHPTLFTNVQAAESEVTYELTPGKHFKIAMDDLGETENKKMARARVFLPSDYDKKNKFPAVVYFSGGGGGTNTGLYEGITEKKRWIIIGLPYKKGQLWGSPLSWYKKMLDRVYKIVPNVNKDMIICAGFSSGGGAAGMMAGCKEGQHYFAGAIPSGLAGHFTSVDKERAKDWPMLIVIGEKDTYGNRLNQCKEYHNIALSHGMDSQLHIIPNVGHSFPKSAFPVARTFLHQKIIGSFYKKSHASIKASIKEKDWLKALTTMTIVRKSQNTTYDADFIKTIDEVDDILNGIGEKLSAQVIKSPSESNLRKFIASWNSSPCADKAKTLYNDLGEILLAKILKNSEKTRLPKVKTFATKWANYPVFEKIREYYDSQVAIKYKKLEKSIASKDHKKIQHFIKSWPHSSTAIEAAKFRLSIALEHLKEIQALEHQKVKKSTTKKIKSKAKKFVKYFADIDNNTIQTAIEKYAKQFEIKLKKKK